MRRIGTLVVAAVVLVCGMSTTLAGDKAPQAAAVKPAAAQDKSPKCPVTGKAIDKSQYSYFRGKRVYLADEGAKKKFEAKPEDYADGIKAQWEVMRPLHVQVVCPMTGQKLDMEVYVEGADARIYFANEEARRAWKQLKPVEQEKRLHKASTFQARCAACNGDIKPTVKRTVKGQDMYFCCDGCAKLATDEPDKYVGKCQEQIKANKRAFVMKKLGGKIPAPKEKP